MSEAVIVEAVRSPGGRYKRGGLAATRGDEIGFQVLKGLLARVPAMKPEEVDDVIVGCAFPEGEQGFNLARVVVFLAGFPIGMTGVTINRFCGSSMEAIHAAAGAIQLGAGEAFLCAGVESMTRVPMLGFNPLPNPALMKSFPQAYVSMGETAENLARQFGISRVRQEEFALASQQKAAAAQAEGRLAGEIVPITWKGGTVSQDGCIRADTSLEGLAGLKLAFDQNGTVTAGTSSPLTDGASATLVCSEEFAAKKGLEPLARIVAIATSGCGPEVMGLGPVESTRKALARAGLKIADLEIIELNEAFASQSLACIDQLGLDPAKINLDGGAIAIGHPLGATGARITGKVAQLLRREGKRYGLATQCIGGGQGIATILEAV